MAGQTLSQHGTSPTTHNTSMLHCSQLPTVTISSVCNWPSEKSNVFRSPHPPPLTFKMQLIINVLAGSSTTQCIIVTANSITLAHVRVGKHKCRRWNTRQMRKEHDREGYVAACQPACLHSTFLVHVTCNSIHMKALVSIWIIWFYWA